MQPDPSMDPQVRELTAETQQLVALAGNYQVATAAHYSAAGADLVRVNGAIDRLEKLRKTMTQPLDAAKKAIMDFFRGPTEQLERAKGQIKRSMIAYDQEQTRIQQEEQRRRDELARQERQRLEREAAEATRKAEEKIAEERRQAEAARAAGDLAAAARHDRAAVRTEERAEAKVDALQTTAAMVVAPVIHRETPKVVGVKGRRVWKFEVTDPTQVPREFLVVDEQKIRRFVGAMKGDTKIAGVRVWDEPDLSAAKGAA